MNTKLVVFLTILSCCLTFTLSGFEIEESSLKPKFEWAPIKKAKKYKVTIKSLDSNGKKTAVIKEIVSNATEYQVTANLTENTLYEVKIVAVRKKKKNFKFTKYIKPKATVVSPTEEQFIEIQAGELLVQLHPTPALQTSYTVGDGLIDNLNNGKFIAPIDLPDGASISKIVVYSKEFSTSSSIKIFRTDRPSATNTEIANVTGDIAGSSGAFTTESADFANTDEIDNDSYQYYIFLNMEGNDSFQSALIYYYE